MLVEEEFGGSLGARREHWVFTQWGKVLRAKRKRFPIWWVYLAPDKKKSAGLFPIRRIENKPVLQVVIRARSVPFFL